METNDVDSCKNFCKLEYPGEAGEKKAIFFAWVDGSQTTLPERYHNTCWCKGANAVYGERKDQTGTTTGKVNCEGMHL